MSHLSNRSTILARRGRVPVRRAALVAASLAALVLPACGETAEPASAVVATGAATQPAFGLVTPTEAAALATDPSITVIDVRTPEEFAEGRLAGAVLIDFSSPAFADEIDQLDPSQPYVVYCRTGNRSGQAVAAMQRLGVDRVWDMDGGVIAWTAAGLPLVP